MQLTKEAFLALVRLGIGHSAGLFSNTIDWSEIEALALQQGLSAVIVDGVEKLRPEQRPPQELLLQWIGETLQDYEYRYDAYKNTIAEMAGFYNSHGFKMMTLKGYACSLNWPKPEHRPCGDIDIWQFGDYKKADALVAKEKGIKIDNSHQHHTVFIWNDFSVENHYDFINTHRHYSHRGLEKIFKELGQDDSHFVEMNGEKVYLPSPNLHALFLVRHALNHFASTGINLRQVLDWAFYAEKHADEIDLDWLNGVLNEYNMTDFYSCMNAICVEDLGFGPSIFHGVQFNLELKDKVLADIMQTNGNELPKGLLSRLLFRYRRWKESTWKYQLCFKESCITAFLNGLKSALVKPSSI